MAFPRSASARSDAWAPRPAILDSATGDAERRDRRCRTPRPGCRTPANGQDALETVTGMALDVQADTPSPNRKHDNEAMYAIAGPYAGGLHCTAKFLEINRQRRR
jgi:hypothetical protein